MQDIQFVTEEEIAALDEHAVENGLQIRQMMELAGFHMLEVFGRETIGYNSQVAVVCGKGNKGGDGLSAARHLANHSHEVSVVLADTDLKPDPQHHLELLEQMDVSVYTSSDQYRESIKEADVVVDALIGYRLDGDPRGVFKEMIQAINTSEAAVISYDIPTGIDATSGRLHAPHISADATLTLALSKQGLKADSAREHVGDLYLGDIGIPDFVYQKIDRGNPFYQQSSLITI